MKRERTLVGLFDQVMRIQKSACESDRPNRIARLKSTTLIAIGYYNELTAPSVECSEWG